MRAGPLLVAAVPGGHWSGAVAIGRAHHTILRCHVVATGAGLLATLAYTAAHGVRDDLATLRLAELAPLLRLHALGLRDPRNHYRHHHHHRFQYREGAHFHEQKHTSRAKRRQRAIFGSVGGGVGNGGATAVALTLSGGGGLHAPVSASERRIRALAAARRGCTLALVELALARDGIAHAASDASLALVAVRGKFWS